MKAQEIETVVDMGHVRFLDGEVEFERLGEKRLKLVAQPVRFLFATVS